MQGTPAISLSTEEQQRLPSTALAALQVQPGNEIDVSANLNIRKAEEDVQNAFQQQRNLIAEAGDGTATMELLLQDPLLPAAVRQLVSQGSLDATQRGEATTIIDAAERQSLALLTQIDTSVKSAYNTAFATLIRASLGLVIISLLCTFAIPGASLRRATNLETKPAR